jgi:hypothetical protein
MNDKKSKMMIGVEWSVEAQLRGGAAISGREERRESKTVTQLGHHITREAESSS